MTTNSTPNPARIVREGDTAASCYYCRYLTGHTSWCPAGQAHESAAPEHITLGAVRRAVAENANLSTELVVENLGGDVWGLIDRELGIVYVMNGGRSSTDAAVDGPADVSVVYENEPDVEVAHEPVHTVEEFVELVGRVEGSPALIGERNPA